MQTIDVEVDKKCIYIIFNRSLENGFEIVIITQGIIITFLVCCVHMEFIQEVGYQLYVIGDSCK